MIQTPNSKMGPIYAQTDLSRNVQPSSGWIRPVMPSVARDSIPPLTEVENATNHTGIPTIALAALDAECCQETEQNAAKSLFISPILRPRPSCHEMSMSGPSPITKKSASSKSSSTVEKFS